MKGGEGNIDYIKLMRGGGLMDCVGYSGGGGSGWSQRRLVDSVGGKWSQNRSKHTKYIQQVPT